MGDTHSQLRELPSVDRLLGHPGAVRLLDRFNRHYVTAKCRGVLDGLRSSIRRGETLEPGDLELETLLGRVTQAIDADAETSLVPVVNATGTILHTNLGRAVLPEAAITALQVAARYPISLEYDVARGGRGKREDAIEPILIDLTGAEAATVVNNNAAAVLIALNEFADRREVIVSRGELIEIGGAFRIPEIMAKSGAILREVGTTNRTHLADYEEAINERTALLLKVHTSNYRIVGFTAAVGTGELAALGSKRQIPVMEDLGSGALIDLRGFGLSGEPLVRDVVAQGVDIVTFSGDKVLGGPQAGLIVGRQRWVSRIERNPLHRALRCDKLTLAALEATLRLYQHSANIADDVPTLRALARPLSAIKAMAEQLVPVLQSALGHEFRLRLEDSTAEIGSGALPTEEIPSKVIVIEHQVMAAEGIAQRFREARPPIIGRVRDGRFLVDLRAIEDPRDVIPNWSGARPRT
ncbi:MAG: L-seryl-tRNA(Sec) selenium transferase [Acidobacteria bacterium]|nr:MAG: L-seryl-tRNA(Sec) selenium transferase [Acidobacteriota bacterium]